MKRTLLALLGALVLLTFAPAQAAEAGETTLKVLGTDGSVTVAVRHQYGAQHTRGTETWYDAFQQDAMVYSTDGATWHTADPGPMAQTYTDGGGVHVDIDAFRGRWDGERFLVWRYPGGHDPAYASADGVHWTAWTGGPVQAWPRGVAELGPYRFELDREGTVWLLDGQSRGLALPTLRRVEYMTPADLQAYYGPNDTVVVEAYDIYSRDGNGDWKTSSVFSKSSLDWCLEHLAQPRLPETGSAQWETAYTAGNGLIACLVQAGRQGQELWTSADGANWTQRELPWPDCAGACTLLPFSGKTFLLLREPTATLYATEDFGHWQDLGETFLGLGRTEPDVYSQFSLAWTGDGYLTSRRVAGAYVETPDGWVPRWESPYNTKVTFCDGQFRETFSYDFGSGVDGVAVEDGVCYAKVQRPREDDPNARVVYTSTDGRQWTATGRADLPGQEAEGTRTAQAGAYRFRLNEDGSLWVSRDGSRYGRLPDLPPAEEATDGIRVCAGGSGVLVLGTNTRPAWAGLGQSWGPYTVRNGSVRGYTNAELAAALTAAEGGTAG